MNNASDTLVIGGTGLVGSHLLWVLAQQGAVTASSRTDDHRLGVKKLFHYYGGSGGDAFYNNIHWISLDILDIEALSKAFRSMKKIYHCAALVSFHRIDFYSCIKMNRDGTANVVNACLENPGVRLCYVSSTAAVGKNPGAEITEDCLWKVSDLNSGYSVSKFGAEKEVWRGIEEGLNAVIINPCTVIGAGRWEEGSMEMFRVANRGLKFYTSGANATVDARDVAKSMVFLMESGVVNERFLCTGTNLDFKTLFALIAEQMGRKKPKIFTPQWLAVPFSYVLETLSLIRKKRQGMTIESAHAAYSIRRYNSKKLKTIYPHAFHSIEESIENAIKGRIKL